MLLPLRTKPDYGENGHRPQDFTDAELVGLAKKLTKEASTLVNPWRIQAARQIVAIAKHLLGYN